MMNLADTLGQIFPAGITKQHDVLGRNDSVENLKDRSEPQNCKVLMRSETRRAANRRTFYLVNCSEVLVYLCISHVSLGVTRATIFDVAEAGTEIANKLTSTLCGACANGNSLMA